MITLVSSYVPIIPLLHAKGSTEYINDKKSSSEIERIQSRSRSRFQPVKDLGLRVTPSKRPNMP